MLELGALFRPIFGIDAGELCQTGELPAHFAIWSALAQRRTFAHGVVESLRIVIHIQAPDETGAHIDEGSPTIIGEELKATPFSQFPALPADKTAVLHRVTRFGRQYECGTQENEEQDNYTGHDGMSFL